MQAPFNSRGVTFGSAAYRWRNAVLNRPLVALEATGVSTAQIHLVRDDAEVI